MHRSFALVSAATIALVVTASSAFAQNSDITVFFGAAYPIFDERLRILPGVPAIPGVDVSVDGRSEIRADGGLVFGAAYVYYFGVFGIEGRFDATNIGFDLTGARYNLRGTRPPLQSLTGSLTIGNGRADVDRLYLMSFNARLRTPGPVGLSASGGLSYLPDFEITGSVPFSVDVSGLPALSADLQLRATTGESTSRWGANFGTGIRIGDGPVGVMAEVRVFYFPEVELRFQIDQPNAFIAGFLDGLGPVNFTPIIVNAQGGIVFRF